MKLARTMTLIAATTAAGAWAASTVNAPAWQVLPPIPDAIGFAGSFAGESDGALLVAGGANFPDRPPWEKGTKTWYDRVFVLESGSKAWREAGRLPAASGYGVSITIDRGVLLIGGGDARHHADDVWLMRWDGHGVRFTAWPRLPRPLAMAAGARVGRIVYVVGGLDRADATVAQAQVYALHLDNVPDGWREVPAVPGGGRFLAVAGGQDGVLYVFGGARPTVDAAGKAKREWLRDAWSYQPAAGWKRLPDLPRPVVAAPSPAPVWQGQLLVIGGDDGAQVEVAPTAHRGFPREVLGYDPVQATWRRIGEVPFSLVTTTAATWRGRIVIPGGEARPGVRSTEVWATTPNAHE